MTAGLAGLGWCYSDLAMRAAIGVSAPYPASHADGAHAVRSGLESSPAAPVAQERGFVPECPMISSTYSGATAVRDGHAVFAEPAVVTSATRAPAAGATGLLGEDSGSTYFRRRVRLVRGRCRGLPASSRPGSSGISQVSRRQSPRIMRHHRLAGTTGSARRRRSRAVLAKTSISRRASHSSGVRALVPARGVAAVIRATG